jgi:hypothetical protein
MLLGRSLNAFIRNRRLRSFICRRRSIIVSETVRRSQGLSPRLLHLLLGLMELLTLLGLGLWLLVIRPLRLLGVGNLSDVVIPGVVMRRLISFLMILGHAANCAQMVKRLHVLLLHLLGMVVGRLLVRVVHDSGTFLAAARSLSRVDSCHLVSGIVGVVSWLLPLIQL